MNDSKTERPEPANFVWEQLQENRGFDKRLLECELKISSLEKEAGELSGKVSSLERLKLIFMGIGIGIGVTLGLSWPKTMTWLVNIFK